MNVFFAHGTIFHHPFSFHRLPCPLPRRSAPLSPPLRQNANLITTQLLNRVSFILVER